MNAPTPPAGVSAPMSANTTERVPRRGRRWPWALLVAGVLSAGLMVSLWHAIGGFDPVPLGIVIDGERVLDRLDLAALGPLEQLLLALIATFVILVVLLVVPVALLLVLAGVVVAVALPLLVALAALAILLSPLILVGWLLWRLLRPSPSIDA